MWTDIIEEFSKRPRDIHTIPLQKGEPVWFYVFSKDGNIYVEGAHEHLPVSKISVMRKLNKDEFEDMLKIFHRRCKGEHISAEATSKTVNQVYWYGIFAELKM